MDYWQINLSLIPSIAVVLNSSNRVALGLTDEINVRLSQNIDAYQEILPHKIQQLKRISIAIVLMYLSLAVLVVNSLLTALEVVIRPQDLYLILFAISLFLVALLLNISFSFHSYKIRQKQFKHFITNQS